MITVEEHQKTLSARGINLPQAEVKKLLDIKYAFAHAFFDMWGRKTNQSAPIIVVNKKVRIHTKNGNIVFFEHSTLVYGSF